MKQMDDLDFSTLAREELEQMRDAGEWVREIYRVLSVTEDNVVGELLRGEETFFEWNHYPDGDIYDSTSHSQYYYHAHPVEERGGEHGHFHTFLRPDGMPPGIAPAPVADYEAPEDPDDALSHLVAISMDSKGFPVKLFTTNRWVTGEIWYKASDVCRLLYLFKIDHIHPSWPVNIWVTNMLILFRPQIKQLIYARDDVIEAWQGKDPDISVFEDRDLEITAEINVDVDEQLTRIQQALEQKGPK
ncbi:MAG: hypothetical protein OEU46_13920 [Alphaproteobacteria bacterium]|nr:hypothetical protein [Alphaproteobacteria bacterium]